MKFFTPQTESRKSGDKRSRHSVFGIRPAAAFTMVELAISLAVIGIALVAIIGVLPLGMRTQRDNRESTVINQDATVFIEAIRNGARGLDDLTNYVYAITNYVTQFNDVGQPVLPTHVAGYDYAASSVTTPFPFASPSFPITNGMNIVGLLSTPEYLDLNGAPVNNLFNGGYSNHVVAYVRSISGPAVEKPPQDNQIIQADAFGYRVYCVNAPVATDTNAPSLYTTNLTVNLHELRLTFLWPQQPNGSLGAGRQTFRALIAGQIVTNIIAGNYLYFYQPQSFTNAP